MTARVSETTHVTRDAWLVFLLAFFARCGACFWGFDRVPPTADGAFYHVVAQRIAAGEGYTWLWPDGAITYAAHYPVGYPAMMAPIYWLFGPHPGWVMLENAVVGALGVWAAHQLCVRLLGALNLAHSRRSALFSGLLLALSPTLILYTPALMTEVCVGAVVTGATLLTVQLRDRWSSVSKGKRVLGLVGLAGLIAFSCYLRPQTILLAVVLGALLKSSWLQRFKYGLLLTGMSLLLVAPWTVRNCERMDSCVFVSANGGWNLLIGTYPDGHGAWIGIDGERVPPECREVFSESGKDECFGQAGKRRVLAAPLAWLSLVPQKLRATLDHSAAGAEHLRASGAIDDEAKWKLQVAEYTWQRFFSVFVLVGVAGVMGSTLPSWLRILGVVVGLLGFLGAGAWFAWLVVLVLVVCNPSFLVRPAVGAGAGVIASTLAVHAVFFGAGRYSIPMWYAAAPLVAVGFSEVSSLHGRVARRLPGLWGRRTPP